MNDHDHASLHACFGDTCFTYTLSSAGMHATTRRYASRCNEQSTDTAGRKLNIPYGRGRANAVLVSERPVHPWPRLPLGRRWPGLQPSSSSGLTSFAISFFASSISQSPAPLASLFPQGKWALGWRPTFPWGQALKKLPN